MRAACENGGAFTSPRSHTTGLSMAATRQVYVRSTYAQLSTWFTAGDNRRRLHSSLDALTPDVVYFRSLPQQLAA